MLSVLDYAPVLLVSADFVQVVFTGHNSEDVKVSNAVLNRINDNILNYRLYVSVIMLIFSTHLRNERR